VQRAARHAFGGLGNRDSKTVGERRSRGTFGTVIHRFINVAQRPR
jgi:hypothetical protein